MTKIYLCGIYLTAWIRTGEKIDWIFFFCYFQILKQKDYIDFISYNFSAVRFVDWDCFF
jgi:hypothetical protein